MKFSVMHMGQPIGTIDVTEEVYEDDTLLLDSLVNAGYVERNEVLEVVEELDNEIDILEYETRSHRLALFLIH